MMEVPLAVIIVASLLRTVLHVGIFIYGMWVIRNVRRMRESGEHLPETKIWQNWKVWDRWLK